MNGHWRIWHSPELARDRWRETCGHSTAKYRACHSEFDHVSTQAPLIFASLIVALLYVSVLLHANALQVQFYCLSTVLSTA